MTEDALRQIVHNVWDRHCDERDMDCVAVIGWNSEKQLFYSFRVGEDPNFIEALKPIFQDGTNWKENANEEIEFEQ